MTTSYFTFGQAHAHSINGFTFDKDIVVKIIGESPDANRMKMFEIFGDKWAFQYDDEPPTMSLFPRGMKDISDD